MKLIKRGYNNIMLSHYVIYLNGEIEDVEYFDSIEEANKFCKYIEKQNQKELIVSMMKFDENNGIYNS